MQQTWKMYMEVETVVSDSKMYQLINFFMILYGNFGRWLPLNALAFVMEKKTCDYL